MADPSRPLSQHTVLARAPDLSIHVKSNGDMVVGCAERRYWAGHHALAILDTFARPLTLAGGLAALAGRAAGAQDWVDLTETILGLYKEGLLVDPGDDGREAVQQPHGFEKPSIHIKMLDDRRRTESFIAGLREVVREGDIVVDVGTGTGVLAVAAVQAGAAHVYAIEAGGAARYARAIFEANGVANRITLLEGWSTQLELPEKADVLVSEIIGNEPLAERVLEATLDARKRFLKSTARLVPSRVRLFCTPMTMAPDDRNRLMFTPERASRWAAWYGIDFAPLVEQNDAWSYFSHPEARTVAGWTCLGPSVLLADLDLARYTDIEIDQTATLLIREKGRLEALVVHFELQLGEMTFLRVDPSAVDLRSSWRYSAWLVAPALEVAPDERLEVRYSYRSAHGEPVMGVSRG